MGTKNIYERFVCLIDRAQGAKVPNAHSLSEQFEISAKTAQRDIDFMAGIDSLPLDYDSSQRDTITMTKRFLLPHGLPLF